HAPDALGGSRAPEEGAASLRAPGEALQGDEPGERRLLRLRVRLRAQALRDRGALRALPAPQRGPRACLDGRRDRLPDPAVLVVLTSSITSARAQLERQRRPSGGGLEAARPHRNYSLPARAEGVGFGRTDDGERSGHADRAAVEGRHPDSLEESNE